MRNQRSYMCSGLNLTSSQKPSVCVSGDVSFKAVRFWYWKSSGLRGFFRLDWYGL